MFYYSIVIEYFTWHHYTVISFKAIVWNQWHLLFTLVEFTIKEKVLLLAFNSDRVRVWYIHSVFSHSIGFSLDLIIIR